MKIIRLLGMLLLLVVTISFSGCNYEESKDKEVYPIRFANNSYEVRVNQLESIGFVDGSGDYTIEVENPELLSATIDVKVKHLSVSAKQKGETYLTIIDNKANGKVRLKIKVTDSYLGFRLSSKSNIPFIPEETDLFLVDNEQKDFFLFKYDRVVNFSVGEPVLKGTYSTKVESEVPLLVLTFQNEEGLNETHTYDISESDNQIYLLMNKFINSGWEIKNARSIGRPAYIMKMKETVEGKVYGANWVAFDVSMPIPEGVLE